jgi:hypothetical protein
MLPAPVVGRRFRLADATDQWESGLRPPSLICRFSDLNLRHVSSNPVTRV